MNDQTLIVFTNDYPYATGETFVENETAFWKHFKQAFVCPLALTEGKRDRIRACPDAQLIDLHYNAKIQATYAPWVAKALLAPSFLGELFFLVKTRKLNKSNVHRLLSITIHSEIEAHLFKKQCKEQGIRRDAPVVLYGYWLYQPALVAVKLKRYFKNAKAVCRGHGFDVYEARSGGYLPYRKLLLSKLDRVWIISENGRRCVAEGYPRFADKIDIARLGTDDYGEGAPKTGDCLELVSCAYCSPVKRIDLLIDALSLLNEGKQKIHWTHYGDGALLEQLVADAGKKLGGNVTYTFKGHIDNKALMEAYRENHYDLFLNVSESEGIPVSIMEALSFGIPVIATDVGGTGELVIPGQCGTLIPKDFAPAELAEKILDMTNLSEPDAQALRSRARTYWREHYSAEQNYSDFMQQITNL